MRDINRIDIYMNRLGEAWKLYPDFRFGQMIMNVFPKMIELSGGKDLFYMEDEQFFNCFEQAMYSLLGKDTRG